MPVGKKIVILLVFAFVGMNVYAQESGFTFVPYGGGGAAAMFDFHSGYMVGGFGEFAFLFYNKELQISNHIIGRGNSIMTDIGNEYGSGSLSEKISLGDLLQKIL